jgi:4-hydroxybenzoate polyprenyltransferase
MKQIKIFVDLTRLNKPIGIMLLFWPCLWGLTLAYFYDADINTYFKNIILFFSGSILMRSAGCIVNDIVDKNFDKKVKRTKDRPIASGKISVFKSLVYVLILCLIAFLILLQFNFLTLVLGMSSMILAFGYPFMKRITYWPQLFLGLTFNWGIIMGWTSIMNNLSLEPIVLYIGAIFWTLGYDTIYGLQDINDDEIIGVKSTSIKFKHNVKFFVGTCYSLFVLFILVLSIMIEIDKYIFILSMFFILSLMYQVTKFNVKNLKSCLHVFKMNNLTGFFIFIFILSFNI